MIDNELNEKSNASDSVDIDEVKVEDEYDIAVPKPQGNVNSKAIDNEENGGVKRFMTRKSTLKWLDEGYQETIKPEEMIKSVNQYHPRMFTENGPELIPLCSDVGWLSQKQGETTHFDKLGKATSIYFRLLKSLIVLFLFFSVMATPLYIMYSAGNVNIAQPF